MAKADSLHELSDTQPVSLPPGDTDPHVTQQSTPVSADHLARGPDSFRTLRLEEELDRQSAHLRLLQKRVERQGKALAALFFSLLVLLLSVLLFRP